ncbi:MAG: DUF1552 domain-containing protein [bacterium]
MARKSWQIDRRQLLCGGGLALGLPLLDGMAWSMKGRELPRRLVVSYISYGVYEPKGEKGQNHPWNWWPGANPGPLEFNESSAPFAPLAPYVSYLRGLDHAGGYGLGGHSSGDVFATGADMGGTEKTNNVSIDQVAAKLRGHETRYASLVLGTEGGTGTYGRAKTLSHRGPGRPIPAEHRPKAIFDGLFRPYAGENVAAVRARLAREASLLDLLLENARGVRRRLGRADQEKVDEYLDSLRSLEQRTQRIDRWTHVPLAEVDPGALDLGTSRRDPEAYTRCLYDLIVLALRTDSTRFVSFMLESEASSDSETWHYASHALGYEGATHDLAHKRPVESGHWDRWRARQHAYFLERLRDTPEGEGNLLDRTAVLWGSAHPHASHSNVNYPLQLAGGNALGLSHGRLHAFEGARKVPLANLLVTLLDAVGAPVERFADSTGPMPEVLA